MRGITPCHADNYCTPQHSARMFTVNSFVHIFVHWIAGTSFGAPLAVNSCQRAYSVVRLQAKRRPIEHNGGAC